MSLKKMLANMAFITTAATASLAGEKSGETAQFLNDSVGRGHWTERVEIKPGQYRNTTIPSISDDTFQKNDINKIYDGWGQTPLTAAVMNGRCDVVSDLIRKGADVNAENRLGQKALTLALIMPTSHPNIAYEKSGAVSGITYSENPQRQADKTEMLKVLIKSGADVNYVDKDGDTPLHIAAGRGNYNAMKLLKEAGADMTVKNSDGRTAEQMYQNWLNYNRQRASEKGK